MEPLLKKSVPRYVGNDKHIKIGFRKAGNQHVVNDVLNRPINLKKNEMIKLDKLMSDAEYVRSSGLYKKRRDSIQRFYYFFDKKRKLYYNVAETVRVLKKGRIVTDRYLYSVTNDIPAK